VPAPPQDPAGNALIAVVDDDEDVRAALDGLLGSLGYRTVLFETADGLLGSTVLDDVDCIISDVQMPGSSGLQLAEAVRPLGTPIILITAFPTTEVEQRATAAGVLRLLIKPFESSDLIDQLSDLLGEEP
jgi:FixJ family two-component response regulator